MRCGAGVFAATRLLWRLLMPSYQFASEKPVCGVCGAKFPHELWRGSRAATFYLLRGRSPGVHRSGPVIKRLSGAFLAPHSR